MVDPLSAGIGAGASVLGNVLGFVQSQQNMAQQNRLFNQQLGLQSSQFQQNLTSQYHFKDRDEAMAREMANFNAAQTHEMFNKSADLQREFAKSGIRWRVEDAIAAGLHPVFALGGAGAAFSSPPAFVGGQPSSGGFSPGPPRPAQHA